MAGGKGAKTGLGKDRGKTKSGKISGVKSVPTRVKAMALASQ